MNINPFILLGIGSFFGLLYAGVIIFGWARTRRNRRILQRQEATCILPTWVLDPSMINPPTSVEAVSLSANHFVDSNGQPIDVSNYSPYIALGESDRFPQIHSGNLVFKDRDGRVCYVFSVVNLANYR